MEPFVTIVNGSQALNTVTKSCRSQSLQGTLDPSLSTFQTASVVVSNLTIFIDFVSSTAKCSNMNNQEHGSFKPMRHDWLSFFISFLKLKNKNFFM